MDTEDDSTPITDDGNINPDTGEDTSRTDDDVLFSIVELEWEMFTGVNDRTAPKASCQEDARTFIIMRSSQARAWTCELRDSYYDDLLAARDSGRNLMTEKYARMMESTNPDQYAAFADRIPPVDEETLGLIEEIVDQHLNWKRETLEKYPKITGRGRVFYTKDDTPYSTSFETYLRGELKTYSPKSVALYHDMVSQLAGQKVNLEEEYLRNTVEMYGYESLEQAEAKA